MKSLKDRITLGPPRDNQVRGPVSNVASARASQQRQGSLDQRAAGQGTPAAGQGSLDPHASQQGSLNPPAVETGSLGLGSLDQRAARQETRAAEHGSLDSGSLNPHASQQGSLGPTVSATGLLDPGSLDQRIVARLLGRRFQIQQLRLEVLPISMNLSMDRRSMQEAPHRR